MTTVDGNNAISPSMYNQSLNNLAKDYIKEELKQQGFGLFDSTLDLEVKKSILSLVFSIVMMICNFMLLFRINNTLTILLMFVSIILFLVFFFKFNLYGILIKQFNERQDEKMDYIIASYIQQRTNRVIFVAARLIVLGLMIAIPYLIFNKPTYLFEAYDDGYRLRYYVDSSNNKEVVVPSEYKGKKVIAIRGNVFKGLNVEKVVLPDSIKEINGHAFENNKRLKEVVMPSSLEILGSQAFKNCTSLEKIDIPVGVKEIQYSTFEGATSLQEVSFNNQEIIIGGYAFTNASSLRKLNNLNPTEIHAYAFQNTSLEDIVLPNGIEEIPAGVFQGTKLTSLDIPASVKKISESAFEGSSILKVTLHDGLEEISESAFQGSGLTSITIPDTVTKISAHVFQDCTSLKSVKLSKNIKEIKSGTFRNTAIEEIDIPTGVTKIGERAFRNCRNLKKVTVPSTLGSIGDSAFRECPRLREITIPGYCSVGKKAFEDSFTIIKRDNKMRNTEMDERMERVSKAIKEAEEKYNSEE